MDRIECSVWNNGGTGWGLHILGGLPVCAIHFRCDKNPILVEINSALFPIRIDKPSFWKEGRRCGHIISVHLRKWFMENRLTTRDRVWLEVVEPFHKFKVVKTPALHAKEVAQ
jgi:hypothetical protein